MLWEKRWKLWLLKQVDLPESGKGYFYIQREWLEEYEYGKDMFYSEYGDDKNYTSNTMPTAYSCRIVFFPLFLRSSIASFRPWEKASPEYLWYKQVNQNNSWRRNHLGEIWNIPFLRITETP